jgi:acyl-CoA thioesterase II
MTPHAATTPQEAVDELITLLDLKQLGEDHYFGPQKPGGTGRIFGGQIIAQALVAATNTVAPDRVVHSLHAYFIRPGDEDFPAEYWVERDFDGRSYSNRRVVAKQGSKVILNFAASFQKPEVGMSHQDAMPDVAPPEGLTSEADLMLEYSHMIPQEMRSRFLRARPVEWRPASPRAWMSIEAAPARQQSWFRLSKVIGDDPLLHRAILAYITDQQLLGTCTMPHGLNWLKGELISSSIDHAVWIHDDFRVDDWMLFDTTSPVSGGGRGLNLGHIYTRDGRMVASVSQEGLIRRRVAG